MYIRYGCCAVFLVGLTFPKRITWISHESLETGPMEFTVEAMDLPGTNRNSRKMGVFLSHRARESGRRYGGWGGGGCNGKSCSLSEYIINHHAI